MVAPVSASAIVSEPRPGTDLDDMIVGTDVGQPGDLADDVGIDDEVLPEVAPRGQSVFAEQGPDVVARVHAYQLMRTGAGASARSLMRVNTSVCSTMSTPAGSGVLSAVEASGGLPVVGVGDGQRPTHRCQQQWCTAACVGSG